MILKLCCYQERHKEGYGYIIYKWHNYEHHYTNKKTFQDFTEIDFFFSCTQFSEKLSKHPIKPSKWEKIFWSPALTPLLPVVFKPWSQESVDLQPSCKCFTLGNLEKQAPFQHMPTICTGFYASSRKLLNHSWKFKAHCPLAKVMLGVHMAHTCAFLGLLPFFVCNTF